MIERLGPYRVLRKIGRGGMGTVYEGVHVETGQSAAIKLLAADLAHQAGFRERFEGEIETLRKLRHPNIVQLFGFGEQDGLLFYSMELVAGSSLEEQLRRGRCFDWRDAVRIGIDMCHALRHAHDRGVIHRDIKPGNLLVTDDGHVKLSDFGIARLFANLRLTGTGGVMGTAEYMAPEQAEGRPVDPRADLYSLGGVLYVLLTRRPLFQGGSFAEILDKQRTERPEPLGQLAPDVPAEIAQLIEQLLEKDPERRIPNAMLLARRLEAVEQAVAAVGRTETSDPEADAEQESVDGPVPQSSEPLAPTQPATYQADVPPPVVPPPVVPPDELGETKATSAFSDGMPGVVPPIRPTEHFVPIAPDELDVPDASPSVTGISVQTWVLAAGLILVGLSIWYLLQPPTADALFARIGVTAGDGAGDSLLLAEDDIRQFLLRFPGDPRGESLHERLRQVELVRLERRLELQAKGLAPAASLVPIEQTYVDVLNCAWLDPDLGATKFQAMIDLYAGKEHSGPTWQCLELAKRRLLQYHERCDAQIREHLALIERQLDEADACRATDPRRAEAMYRAVVELYHGKAWAASAVARAKNRQGG
jgi:serine/threonine-protein kinase